MVALVRLSGADLLAWLQAAAKMTPGSGAFPQTAGLRMVIVGNQLQQATIGGQPIDPRREYRLALTNFTASGGDGYTVLADACKRPGNYCRDTGIVLLDLLVEQLKTGTPLAASLDGRITRQ